MRISERVYRWLLRVLPSDFRGDYADAMLADVGSGPRTAAFWWREIGGLMRTVVREHLDALRQDVKYSLRMMRRSPGFTAIAILMLALGTGVNASMFSVVDAVMLQSPFRSPGQLAFVGVVAAPGSPPRPVPLDRLAEIAASPALDGVGVVTNGTHALTGLGDPRGMDNVECVSASLFGVLQAAPLLGRTFDASEDQPGAAPTVVLSYNFWKEIGGQPSILGTPLTINQTPVTVIGVMPRGFYGAYSRQNTEAWLPYRRPIKSADNAGCRKAKTAAIVARVKDGLTFADATARTPGFTFRILESVWMEDARTPLKVLTGAVACVLLIACFNVGGLQMERTLARRRELSVRLALGAGRGRLARQIVTENLVFALAGALAGGVATVATLQALKSILPPNMPYVAEVEINGRVLLVTLAAAASAGLISGLFPILETRRFSASEGLSGSTRSTERRASWTRRGLVIGEVGLSIVVLIGAALMIQTFLTLRPASPGFDPDHKLWQPVRLRAATAEAARQFFPQVLDGLRGAPGVAGAAGTTYVPMINIYNQAAVTLGGVPKQVCTNSITENYFSLMRIPLKAGRAFLPDDAAGAAPVVIVNETLARRINGDGQVIGVRLPMVLDSAGPRDAPVERTIVGVIADTRGTGGDVRARSEAYVPFAQDPDVSLMLVVEYVPGRSAEAAAAVRSTLRRLRPDLVVAPPSELRAMIDKQVATPRFGAWLLGIFAGLALVLAGIGLMTTIGWWVNQRTRELGVRMALGASRSQITGLVARQGMTLAAAGVAAGCGVAGGLTRYMTSFIYGVTPLDPRTFAGAAALMLMIAAAAIYVPMRRATRVDPVTALRAD
jgi:predicted permease